MIIFQKIDDVELLEKLKKACQQLGVEYLVDVDAPESISKFVLWQNPPDDSSSKLKKRLVASLISQRIMNNGIAWFIFKELTASSIERPAQKTKKLIVSLSGESLTSDEDVEEIKNVISKWT